MEKSRIMKKKRRTAILGMAAVLSILLVGLSGFLINSVQNSMWKNAETHVMEMTARSATILKTRVKAEVRGLRDLGMGITAETPNVLSTLNTYQEEHGLPELAIVDTSGAGFFSDGSPVDLSDAPEYASALKGEALVSSPFLDKRGDWQLSIQVPVYRGNEVYGALYANCSLENFYEDYSVNFYDGQGFCHTVDRNGTLILAAKNDPADVSDNLLEALRQENPSQEVDFFARALREQESTQHIFTYLGVRTFFGCVPVGNDDRWSVVSIIPCSAIQSESRQVLFITLVICGAIIACFLLVAFLLLKNARAYYDKVLEIAYTDPVTDGNNFTRFKLETERLLQKNPAEKYAVLYTDIKNFKYINDVYGFDRGNLVLRHFARILSQDGDREIFARLNGDTFVSLCRYRSEEALLAHCEALQDKLRDISGVIDGSAPLTIYTGVYCTGGENAQLSVNEMIDRANIAQKKAKSLVVGGCAIYSEDIRRAMLEEQALENRMLPALQNGEFVVYLQPKYGIKTGSAVSAEALVRWEHPGQGLIPPDKFIPLFERNGFIQQLDAYMFEQVCKLLRGWIDEGKTPLPISVNVSRFQLNNEHFLQNYFDIRNSWRIPDQLIEIEFTESLVFENAGRMTSILQAFHENGFLCSIDDFGSGYSSLNLLKDLPVDILKLDKVFFDKGQHQEREHIIIRSVIDMAKKLSMQTIAEGVERWDQVEFLQEAGCELVQGYVFDRPLPARVFEEKYILFP